MSTTAHVHLLQILQFPLPQRCQELQAFFEYASIYDLSNIFPALVNSIFDPTSPGWNLRRITREHSPLEYDSLHDFFSPLRGPMIRLCYRLMERSKYEVPLTYLPTKMQHMLISGRYPSFYSKRVTIDPFTRRAVGLSLNSFDYFLTFFALYGLIPYRNLYQTVPALHVPQNNDHMETIYLMLAADFCIVFVPSNPDVYLLAPDVTPLKSTQQPTPKSSTKTKYLLPQQLYHHEPVTKPHRMDALAQAVLWRSEGLIHLFMDTWLGSELDESNIDLVRYVRILVKQLHAFTNCTEVGTNTQVEMLRRDVEILFGPRMTGFLRPFFMLAPLDGTFTDVLELWLSYIQPWRYVDGQPRNTCYDTPIHPRYELFIERNLNVYTEMCAWFVSRLADDNRENIQRNGAIGLLFRALKVFGQGNLMALLREQETLHLESRVHPHNIVSIASSGQKRQSQLIAFPFDDDRPALIRHEGLFVPLFSGHLDSKLEALMVKICTAVVDNRHLLEQFEAERSFKASSWLSWLQTNLVQRMEHDKQLTEATKMGQRLAFVVEVLEQDFGVRPVYVERVSVGTPQQTQPYPTMSRFPHSINVGDPALRPATGNESTDSTEHASVETSQQPQPNPTVYRLLDPFDIGDSTLKPITGNECTVLVRFLYQVSIKLNVMFGDDLQRLWDREGFLGMIVRRLLLPPTTINEFVRRTDGGYGGKVLETRQVGPRVSLRFLGTYASIFCIGFSFVLGYILLGVPSFGFLTLLLLAFLYMLIRPGAGTSYNFPQ